MLLGIVEVSYSVLGTESRSAGRKEVEEVKDVVLGEIVIFRIPFVCVAESFAEWTVHTLCLIAELVVKVLVEEKLDDDLVFVSVVTEAKAAAGLLQGIDQLLGGLFYVYSCHCWGRFRWLLPSG